MRSFVRAWNVMYVSILVRAYACDCACRWCVHTHMCMCVLMNECWFMCGTRNFCQGGPGPTARKQPGQLFFSPQLMLQFTEGVQWFYFRDNYTFPRIQRGPIFSRGSYFSQGGSNAYFFRNPYQL